MTYNNHHNHHPSPEREMSCITPNSISSLSNRQKIIPPLAMISQPLIDRSLHRLFFFTPSFPYSAALPSSPERREPSVACFPATCLLSATDAQRCVTRARHGFPDMDPGALYTCPRRKGVYRSSRSWTVAGMKSRGGEWGCCEAPRSVLCRSDPLHMLGCLSVRSSVVVVLVMVRYLLRPLKQNGTNHIVQSITADANTALHRPRAVLCGR
ncbi:hypothetical protein BJX96DRAFT_139385 [Aspergillus floccosus]